MTTSWLQLSLKANPAALDTIANFLIERGSPGVLLKEGEVRAFFPTGHSSVTLKRDIRRFLNGIGEIYPEVTGQPLRWTILRDKNWKNSWRRFFTPQRIAKSILVTPPWHKVEKTEQRKVIEIEPGMAFGTGTHPTTRGCLEFLEEVVRTRSQCLNALDVGTGSGILAITLAKLGVKSVVALDIDPVAIKVATGNVKRNRVDGRVLLSSSPFERFKTTFQVVVANLTAETIVAMAPQLKRKVARGGVLILSGILGPKEKEVLAHFPKPFVLLRRKENKGWTTLALSKGT